MNPFDLVNAFMIIFIAFMLSWATEELIKIRKLLEERK